jgi:hypothetical protein
LFPQIFESPAGVHANPVVEQVRIGNATGALIVGKVFVDLGIDVDVELACSCHQEATG